MLKKILCISLLVTLVVLPVLVMGSELPQGKWWRNPRVVKQLNLNDKQIDQLDEKFIEYSRKLIKLKSAVQIEQFELGALFESKTLDENAVMKQLKKLDKARAELQEEWMRLVIETRKIIGYESFRTLKEYVDKRTRQKVQRFKEQQGDSPDYRERQSP